MRNLMSFEDIVSNNINSTNLEYIRIVGLFRLYDVKLNFDREVNIYIGENGLGKTTILNCVYFILKKDYLKLAEIDFAKIAIKFSSEKSATVIDMEDINAYNTQRMPRRGYYEEEYLEYIIHDVLNKPLSMDIMDSEDFDIAALRFSNTVGIPIPIARRQISQYLRGEKINYRKKGKPGNAEKVEELSNLIDAKIKQKILYFTTYRRIEDDFSKLLSKEEKMRESKDTLIRFGMSDVDKSIKGMLDKIRENSIEGFNKMTGVLLKQYAHAGERCAYTLKKYSLDSTSLNKEMLKIILERLGNEVSQNDREKIIHLLDTGELFNRQHYHLLNLISKLVENYDKQRILDDKIKKFANICNKYLNRKQFVYNQSELTLTIYLQNEDESFRNSIALTNLSSGEKQIVSLFAKLYLDNEHDCILVIDEPELSLSIKWQKMLLPDVMRSGNCKLLLTVTHSPFIFTNEFDYDTKEMHTCIQDNTSGGFGHG